MLKVFVFVCFAAVSHCQIRHLSDDPQSVPTPYQYSYTVPVDGGSHSKTETGDGNGRVHGSYEINEDDGRSRLVQYVADEGGFRASVSTNEPGTASQSPADVNFRSSAEDIRDRFISSAPDSRPVLVVPVPETGFTPINLTPAEPRFRPALEPRVTPIGFVLPGQQQPFTPIPPPLQEFVSPASDGNQGLALFLIEPVGSQRLDLGGYRSQLRNLQLRPPDNTVPLIGGGSSQILTLLRP